MTPAPEVCGCTRMRVAARADSTGDGGDTTTLATAAVLVLVRTCDHCVRVVRVFVCCVCVPNKVEKGGNEKWVQIDDFFFLFVALATFAGAYWLVVWFSLTEFDLS